MIARGRAPVRRARVAPPSLRGALASGRARQAGFTLLELVIVIALGSIVASAALQALTSVQRTFLSQTAQMDLQQSSRAGIAVLSGELRGISPGGGELQRAAPTLLEADLLRAAAMVCSVSGSTATLSLRSGRFVADLTLQAYEEGSGIWTSIAGTVTTGTGSCPAPDSDRPTAQIVLSSGSLVPGILIRGMQRVFYGAVDFSGTSYLAQCIETSSSVCLSGTTPVDGRWYRVAGPIDPSIDPFRYLDAEATDLSIAGAVIPSAVRQVEVTLASAPGVLTPAGVPLADTLSTRITFRN